MIALTQELKTDLAMLAKTLPDFQLPPWVEDISVLGKKLATIFNTDPVRDNSALQELARQPLQEFLSQCGKRIPPENARRLRAVRGLLSLELLAHRGQIPTGLARECARWFIGGFPQQVADFRLNSVDLSRIAARSELSSDTVKLLNHLISALRSELSNPFEEIENFTPKIHISTSSSTKQQNEKTEILDEKPKINEPKNILDKFLAEQSVAVQKQLCGVPTFDSLYPFELEIIWPKVLAELDTSHANEILCAAIALLVGVLPAHYHLIPIANESNHEDFTLMANGEGIQLNLDRIAGLTNSKISGKRHQRLAVIPFPWEICNKLAILIKKNPEAKRLDQLFDDSVENLHQATRKFLRTKSLTAHRPSLTRISKTWGRYILEIFRDEAYASLVAFDFTIGTSANFNYLTLPAEKLKDILTVAYQKIGFSGKLALTNIPDIRSPRCPSEHQAQVMIKDWVDKIRQLKYHLPKRCSLSQLIETHNLIAINTYSVFKFLSGARPLKEETVTRSQLDIDSGLAMITDKRISRYHNMRPVLLSNLALACLQEYENWLGSLASRLATTSPSLAQIVPTPTHTPTFDCDDSHPFFFRFNDEHKIVSLGAKDITPSLNDHGIKANAGRHWVDSLSREKGIDSATMMGYFGRGNQAQELFSRWSAAVPGTALKPVADAINKKLTEASLYPPAIRRKKTPYVNQSLGKKQDKFLPKLLQSVANKEIFSVTRFYTPEPCPFSKNTVPNLVNFSKFFIAWRNSSPPPDWTGLALSLIFEDGVINPVELEGCLQEIANGKVYVSPSLAFVDSKSTKLGIRRVYLSITTWILIKQVSKNNTLMPESFSRFLDKKILHLKFHGETLSLHQVIKASEAFFSLHLPAVLSSWAKGKIFARTTRPETVARHIAQLPEVLKFNLQRKSNGFPATDTEGAFRDARIELDKYKSHRKALEKFSTSLNTILQDANESFAIEFEVGYLLYLASTQNNFDTVCRYAIGARSFIKLSSLAIDNSSVDEINWQSIVNQALGDKSERNSPEIAAINHALFWLGIDTKIFQPICAPPCSRKYAEIPSKEEIDSAIGILLSHSIYTLDDWHLAELILRILSQHAIRWDALIHVRVCDVYLECNSPHLIITPESGGALKTPNAPSVHLIDDPITLVGLKKLRAIRIQRFPNDPLVPLLGDFNNPRTIFRANQLHTMITAALRESTGSSVIKIHDLRHYSISNKIKKVLSDAHNNECDSLYLRQALFDISFNSGHGHPEVTTQNYTHDFDWARREWVSRILAKLKPPSDLFISTILGVTEATIRKRRSRAMAGSGLLRNEYTWDDFQGSATIVELSELVSCRESNKPINLLNGIRRENKNQLSIYTGLRLLGEPRETINSLIQLSNHETAQIDAGLSSTSHRLGEPIKSRPDISRTHFLDKVSNTELCIAMNATQPTKQSLVKVELALHVIGSEWRFRSAEDALDLEKWIKVLLANNIYCEFLLRPTKRSAINSTILEHAKQAGFASARTIAARHFPSQTQVILRFSAKFGFGQENNKFRACPQTNFLVSVLALTIIWNERKYQP